MVADLIVSDIYEIPDISHLTGDWLTVARMHLAVINDPTLPPIDHAISRSGLKALLNRYDPLMPVTVIPLVKAKSKRGRKPSAFIPRVGASRKPAAPAIDRPVLSLMDASKRANIHLSTARAYCQRGWWQAIKIKHIWWVYEDQELTIQGVSERTPTAAELERIGGRPTMPASEAAAKLGIHLTTLWKRCQNGKLDAIQLADRNTWLIYADQPGLMEC